MMVYSIRREERLERPIGYTSRRQRGRPATVRLCIGENKMSRFKKQIDTRGGTYHLHSKHLMKKFADKEARRLRSEGYNATVVGGSWLDGKMYAVYKRRRK